MIRPRFGALLLAGLQICLASRVEGSSASTGAGGIIVERIGTGSLGERAGLRPGDVLSAWRLQPSFPANPFPAAGSLATPFDLLEALIEQAPRGKLTLIGSRAGQPRSWTLIEGASLGRALIQSHPPLRGEALTRYEEALRLLEQGEIGPCQEAWREASERAFAGHEGAAGLWLRYRQAEVWMERRLAGWESLPKEVATLLLAAGQDLAAAELYAFSGDLWSEKGEGARAEADWRQALASLAPRDRRSLAVARAHAGLGFVLTLQDRVDLAQPHLEQALAIRAASAPWSLDLAESLLAAKEPVSPTGTLESLLKPQLESEFLLRRLDPGSLRHVRRLLALGELAQGLGFIAEAERFLREGLRYARIAAPISREAGTLYTLLALIASNRTALPEAEEFLRGAIDVYGRLPPTVGNLRGRSAALALLGSIRADAGDLEAAEHQGRLAIRINAELGPQGSRDLLAHDLLAPTLIQLGRFGEARALLSESLAAKPREEGNGRNRARTLRTLGELELREGKDLPAAGRALQEARELYESSALRGISLAYVLRLQGEVEGVLGHRERALGLLLEALARQRELVPGGMEEAATLRLIGLQHQAMGNAAEASRFLCDAATTLDRLGDRIGRSEGPSSKLFAAQSVLYSDCIESLVGRGENGRAFQVLESGHARGLLEMMAHRDVSTGELDAETRAERKRLRERYETLYGTLSAGRAASDPEGDDATRLELASLQLELDALADRVRRESPRFAALHYPVPLGLDETRRALDPGTLLLAYSIGESQGSLFVVRAAGAAAPGLTVHPLAISSERLRRDVQALTTLMVDRRADRAATRARALALYRLLIAPAAREIAGSERLLIAPDGPLHGLPFAALLRPDGRYLVEAKPLHTIVSATVYAAVKKERRKEDPSQEKRLVAFGDPLYPVSSIRPEPEGAEPEAGLVLRGVSLAPLPGTRREVEAIGALYPNSRVFVGREATEERVKEIGQAPSATRLVHFAGHAVLDQRMPINSFLALSLPEHPVPGQENGLLQAWEIFEDVRLDADLVTLSACNTALGKEMGGEGLIGLTRAFQFAGARSVLASLWAIGDGATARFMPRFYEHLRQGLTKDQALRQTQIEWIRDPRRNHPYHWAAFELIGDYR